MAHARESHAGDGLLDPEVRERRLRHELGGRVVREWSTSTFLAGSNAPRAEPVLGPARGQHRVQRLRPPPMTYDRPG